jgi:hypothetical protein
MEVDFPGADDYAAWSESFDWAWTQHVVVDATPNGTLLIIDGHRFRFSEMSVEQMRSVIEPHREKVGSGINPQDPPPPPLNGDLTFEPKGGGCDIFHRAWIAADHEDFIDASAEWLRDQPGVDQIVHDDIAILLVKGVVDDCLQRALRTWWAEKLEGLDSA